VAVVAGAGGIGRAAASALSRQGAAIALFDLAEETLDETARGLRADGANVTTLVGDIASAEQVAGFVKHVAEALGPVDVIVNAAGVQRRVPALEITLDVLDWMWRANVRGVVAVTQAFLPQMVERGSGRIINVASLGSLLGLEQRAMYALTKGAIAQYTRSIAVELGGSGIRANALAPGYIETEMTREWLTADPERTRDFLARIPVGRFGRPEDLEQLFVFLASPASDYVTGQLLVVDGGWSAW
jgi:NAD(P)-dependent dehydrogenase (short-subunit alcohol dehydrogenase family)